MHYKIAADAVVTYNGVPMRLVADTLVETSPASWVFATTAIVQVDGEVQRAPPPPEDQEPR